jgi:hypothetical protein
VKCKKKFPDCGIHLRTVCECCNHIDQLNFEIKLLQQNKWVSVNDRMPPDKTVIDIWDGKHEKRTTDFMYYVDIGFIGYSYITHWKFPYIPNKNEH